MTLRTRFIVTIGGVALLLVLPALYSAERLSRLQEIATGMSVTHGEAYLAMGRFQAQLAELNQRQRAHVSLRGEGQTAARRDSAILGIRAAVAELGRSGYTELADSASRQITSIEAAIRRNDQLLARDAQEATDSMEIVRRLFATADSLVVRIGHTIDENRNEDLAQAGRISASALTTTLLALVACFFIAMVLGAWTTQTVVLPITRLRRAMAAVSAGEFVVPAGLPYDRNDELGDLSRSFRSMTQQLADLDRMKAEFISVATHELKTPINVVSGYAELIQEGVYGRLTEKQEEALTSIQEQSRILTQLVNQLLDISRLEAGGLKLEITDLNVVELFDRIRRTYQVLAEKQGIHFVVELDPDAPDTIPADGDRLRDQVIGNLLTNALKFTPEGGRITVRGWQEDGQFEIEVSDTGSGMPADQLPHVFDKYFQIGEQARSKGAGLGLAIAHEIVLAHGGTITVESEEGAGTTFNVQLPLSRQQMERAIAAHQTVAVE